MKRDEHLMRLLLLELQGEEKVDLSKFSKEQVEHHKYLLFKAGLAEGADMTGVSDKYGVVILTGLTNKGHDFLSSDKRQESSTPVGSIYIGGHVGPGAAIGPGASVQAQNIAGGDIHIYKDQVTVRYQKARKNLLQKVRAYWIEGLLEHAMHHVVRLELRLMYKHEAVEQPWMMDLLRPHDAEVTIPPGISIIDIFQKFGSSMLILGEAGSGKTIALLELARNLLHLAETNNSQPIPVVFNLASWGHKNQSLRQWLINELHTMYKIKNKDADAWLQLETFHLLLDGLDEVAKPYQADCVKAINEFQKDNELINVVVCSRTTDYESIKIRLKLPGAIAILPLTPEQVDHYLAQDELGLSAMRGMILSDEGLGELIASPLMLDVITKAFKGGPIKDLGQIETASARRYHLFNTYIQRMFRGRPLKEYTQTQAIDWLSWIARQMIQRNQTILYTENVQPDWLETGKQKLIYMCIYLLGIGAFFGFSIWILGATVGRSGLGLVFGLGIGFLFGASALLFAYQPELQFIEVIEWSWPRIKQGLIWGLLGGLFFGLGLAALGHLILSLIYGTVVGVIAAIWVIKTDKMESGTIWARLMKEKGQFSIFMLFGLFFGLVLWWFGKDEPDIELKSRLFNWLLINSIGLFMGLFFGLARAPVPHRIETKTKVNQGIWNSLKSATEIGVVWGIFAGFIGALGGSFVGNLIDEQIAWTLNGLISGVIFGFMGGLFFGGVDFDKGLIRSSRIGGGLVVFYYFASRFLLFSNRNAPRKLVSFLNDMVSRIFLYKIGVGYIFIHRLMLEHFASLHDNSFEE